MLLSEIRKVGGWPSITKNDGGFHSFSCFPSDPTERGACRMSIADVLSLLDVVFTVVIGNTTLVLMAITMAYVFGKDNRHDDGQKKN